jgi:hypothetical protein
MTTSSRFLASVLASAAIAFVAVAPACVSDPNVDAVVADGGGDEAAAPMDSGTNTTDGTMPVKDSSTPDTGVTCPTGTADCDPKIAGCETSTLTDDANCGACAHDCGGTGLCKTGVCSSMVIADKINAPFSLAVAGPSAFWMVDDEVDRCPVTGCPTAFPSDVGNGVHLPAYSGIGTRYMAADATTVYFPGWTTDNQVYSIFSCPDSGCGLTMPSGLYSPSYRMDQMVANSTRLYWLDPLDDLIIRVNKSDHKATNIGWPNTMAIYNLAVDETHLFATDQDIPINGGGLFVCTVADDCASGVKKLLDYADHVASNGTTAFVSQKSGGTIASCDATNGCSGSGTTLATGENGVTSIAVDDKNVYWTIKGSGTAPDGTVRACALPDCKPGPRTIAGNQAWPIAIQVVDNFVYWMNKGTTTANTGQVVRIRK